MSLSEQEIHMAFVNGTMGATIHWEQTSVTVVDVMKLLSRMQSYYERNPSAVDLNLTLNKNDFYAEDVMMFQMRFKRININLA